MAYSHQTLDLKAPLGGRKLESYIGTLHETFRWYQTTGYSMPDGKNWIKRISQDRYLIFPVDGNFGIAIEIGNKPKDSMNRRMATVYPRLNFAVLGDSWSLGEREKTFLERLTRMGYRIAEKRSNCELGSGKKTISLKPPPYSIAAKETGCFRTPEVFELVLKNVNSIVGRRPDVDFFQADVFSPPGDGGFNSPVGKTRMEIDYCWVSSNVLYQAIVPVRDGIADREKLSDIFLKLEPDQTIGVSSRTQLPRSLHPKVSTKCDIFGQYELFQSELSGNQQTPMIDFGCTAPEDAIHTIERLNLDPKGAVFLDSGQSFHAHFPGELRDDEGMKKYFEDLKNCGEVCENWVPLQERQGYQLLRVAPCIKKPKVPTILDL